MFLSPPLAKELYLERVVNNATFAYLSGILFEVIKQPSSVIKGLLRIFLGKALSSVLHILSQKTVLTFLLFLLYLMHNNLVGAS